MEHFNNKDEIGNHCYGNATTYYGSVIIDTNQSDNIYHWKLEILQCGSNSGIAIGIDESQEKWYKNGYVHQTKTINYAYKKNGEKWNSNKKDNYGPSFGAGDIVEMIVNINCSNNQRTISFIKNGKNLGVAFKNIEKNKKYKLTVYLYADLTGPSLKLLSFKQTKSNQEKIINDDEKQTKIQQLMEENNILKAQNVKIKNEFEEKQKESQKVTNDLKIKLNEKDTKIQELEEENKELQIENISLKKEIKNLKISSINPLFYRTWNTEQIILWIMLLENGRFKKYENVLNEGMKGIKGKDLNKVNDLVIKYWGLTNDQDIKCLNDCIRRLCSNQTENNQNDEGGATSTDYM